MKINIDIVNKIIKRIENELKYKNINNKHNLIELEMDSDSFFFIGDHIKEVLGYLPFIINEIESVIFKNNKVIFIINKE